MAVLLALYWSPVLVTFPLVILLFPDGRLPSRRWRPVLWAYLGTAAVWPVSIYVVAIGVIAGHTVRVVPGGDLRAVDFPAGTSAWLLTVEEFVLPLLAVFWLTFAGRQVLAWRRADGVLRQQLKWLMSGTAVCTLSVTLVAVGSTLYPNAPPAVQTVASVVTVGIVALPAAIGVAITRYRLYDIDRIVSRTLAYTIVTGLLAGMYAGLVLLATDVLAFKSPVAIAIATLAAAALFNPLRRWVQRMVDRRFNRAHFDAERTVAAFAARLQDATDSDGARADLLDVVYRSLEPAHASIWLKAADSG